MEDNKLSNSNAEHLENQDSAENVQPQSSGDFSSELNSENNNLDAEKFTQKQEQYKQMLEANAPNIEEDRYIWRIGFGRRVGAYLIDNIFVILLFAIVAFVTGVADELMSFSVDMNSWIESPGRMDELTDFANYRIMPLFLAITFIYYSLEIIFAQSLGKMLLGIVIGDADKRFASYLKLLYRFLLKNISSVISLFFLFTSFSFLDSLSSILGFVLFVGCFFVLGGRKQAIHDIMVGTAVYFKDELQQLDTNKNKK